MDCPVSLKSVKPYLDRASEVQAKDPIVAYHCRLFALQEAMKLRASVPKADMGFVLSLMDQCEKEKGALGEMDEPAITVENFAQDLFQRADDADHDGHRMRVRLEAWSDAGMRARGTSKGVGCAMRARRRPRSERARQSSQVK